MRKITVLLVALTLMTVMSLVAFAAPDQRPFSPVQDGYVATAPEVDLWAPDHLLVQFTTEGYQRANLPGPGEKATSAKTGLAAVDAMMTEFGVTSLRPAFPAAAAKSVTANAGAGLWYVFEMSPGADIPTVAKRLAADVNVANALPDLVAFPAVIPNDPLHANNWGHNNTAQLPDLDWGGTYSHTLPTTVGTPGFDTNAQAAWNAPQGYGSSSVIIAILDSGVDAGHPDLVQVAGYDHGDGDSNPTDDSADPGHGTACAGVAAAIANNALGADGVAGGCSIMPMKVANSAGSMFFSAITNAVYWATDHGADIISLSLGAATTSYGPLDAAFTYAYNNGVTILAATGNENASQISYPAYNPLVLGIGAASPCGDRKRSSSSSADVNPGINTDPNGYTCDGERWWGSNYGSTVMDSQGAVDVIAPTILPTTDIQGSGGYASGDYSYFFNGTSCATPYAAGVAALIKSANPSFSPLQVITQLKATAQDVVNVESGAGWDRYSGYGMVDAAAAVGAVIPPAVQASFTVSDSTGCAPLTVNFTDTSTGNPTAWQWTFGGIGFSNLQNPSYTFTAPGVYDVALSITAPEGNDSVTKIGYIVVGTAPAVSFTPATLTIINAGDSVNFTDTSTDAPFAWAWDFGDGGTANVQNPTHVFNTPGVWGVTLVATNACGSNSLTVPNLIVVQLPPSPEIHATIAPATALTGPVSLLVVPDGNGQALTSAQLWDGTPGNAPVTVDATISVQLLDGLGQPVVGFPANNITVAAQSGGWTECAGNILTADGPTDAAGLTTISGVLFAGGHSAPGELLQVVIDDPQLMSTTYPGGLAGLEYWINSPDIGGDLDINLIDVASFAGAYGVAYDYAVDYVWDGALNLTDITVLAQHYGATCAPGKALAADEKAAGTMSVAFDASGATNSRLAAPGEPVTAYLLLRGADDVQDVAAFDVRLRTSPNVVIHERALSGTGLNLAEGNDFVVGLSDPAKAAGSGPLTLVKLELSVTDDDPAYFWLEPSQQSALARPTFVAGGKLRAADPVSGDVKKPVASLNDKDFALNGGEVPGAQLTLGVAPNPFNPQTEIRFNLPASGSVELRIFDASGRLVTVLTDEVMPAGVHRVVWRGTDQYGRNAASGVYFARLKTDGGQLLEKMMLLK